MENSGPRNAPSATVTQKWPTVPAGGRSGLHSRERVLPFPGSESRSLFWLADKATKAPTCSL